MQRAFILILVVLSVSAIAARQRLERVNPKGLSTPQTYAHIVKAVGSPGTELEFAL